MVQTAGGIVRVAHTGDAATPLGMQSGVLEFPGSPNLLSAGLLSECNLLMKLFERRGKADRVGSGERFGPIGFPPPLRAK